jgi:hypothetical protein
MTECDLRQWSAASWIVNDGFDDSLDITVTLTIVVDAKLSGALAMLIVRLTHRRESGRTRGREGDVSVGEVRCAMRDEANGCIKGCSADLEDSSSTLTLSCGQRWTAHSAATRQLTLQQRWCDGDGLQLASAVQQWADAPPVARCAGCHDGWMEADRGKGDAMRTTGTSSGRQTTRMSASAR